MEGKSEESGAGDEAAPPLSVAKLAGIFGDKIVTPRKEAPPLKPTRRKPPCSLPLPKPEATNNGEEKVSPPHSQAAPKIKVKSSPLIEKLQANLAFAPAAFLPGASPKSPKSPGLKVMASPFNSPPSTPSSPGLHPRSSEPEESPVSFEQPAEGTPLPSFTKVRSRGSLKRRPPSRRFRKSQTDMDFNVDAAMPKENGDKGTEEDAGGVKGNKEGGAAHTDSAPESPTNTQEEGNNEKQEANASPEAAEQKGDNSNKEEGTLDIGLTDIAAAAAEQEAVTGNAEEPGSSQERAGSTEHSEPEAEDKPEK